MKAGRARFALFVLLAAALWLPNMHHLHTMDAPSRARLATSLAERQIATPKDDVERMRATNPEWDFMRRTFTVLSLANLAEEKTGRERARLLGAIDAIVDATLRDDERLGAEHFLLAYARRGPFLDRETRSVFIDGEIVMMLEARELVEPRPELRPVARMRAERIERTMRRSPSLSAESYPDECWTFCNTTALAALAMLDRVDDSDHGDLSRTWVAHAKAHLVDPATGLLVSSFTYDGRVLDGPEGSSIWMSAHNLLFVDEAFARDQYARARRELRGSALGYAWAREWPASVPGDAKRPDVDSGPIVPIVDASAGSSGLALLGASAFDDEEYLGGLLASLELAAFRDGDRYLASNAVGDAVLLYALTGGPRRRLPLHPLRVPA